MQFNGGFIDSLRAGYVFMPLLSSDDFFQNKLSQKIISGTLSECQTVWIQIRTVVLSVLIWVQTVCKGYQQTTKVAASKESVNLKSATYNLQQTTNSNFAAFSKITNKA